MVFKKDIFKLEVRIVLENMLMAMFIICNKRNYYSDTMISNCSKYMQCCKFFTFRRTSTVRIWVFPSISLNGTSMERILNEMKNEVRRLMSFHRVHVETSYFHLAEAGFFATGTGDQTMCFSCGVTHHGWQRNDDPGQVHRALSPSCLHANGYNSGNVPVRPFHLPSLATGNRLPPPVNAVSSDETSEQRIPRGNDLSGSQQQEASDRALIGPVSGFVPGPPPQSTNSSHNQFHSVREGTPSYYEVSSRIRSFQSWPNHTQDPRDLAKAGFYYTGNSDCVRCFCCGVGLKSWEVDDDPWIEHVRWRQSCDYVRRVKGEEFIRQTSARQHRFSKGEEDDNHPPWNATYGADFSHLLSRAACRAILDLGCDEERVLRHALDIVARQGIDGLSYSNLVHSIMCEDLEGKEEEDERGEISRDSSNTP